MLDSPTSAAGNLHVVYLKNADWKRDPNARVNVDSLKKLAVFMHDKLQWLEKPVNVDGMVDLSFLPR